MEPIFQVESSKYISFIVEMITSKYRDGNSGNFSGMSCPILQAEQFKNRSFTVEMIY